MLVTLHLLRHHAMWRASTRAKTSPEFETQTKWLARNAVFMPGFVAIFVAFSRVHDNAHHPADVVAGSALGSVIAALSHRIAWPKDAIIDGYVTVDSDRLPELVL